MTWKHAWCGGMAALILVGLAVPPAAAQSGAANNQASSQSSPLASPAFAAQIKDKSIVVVTRDGQELEGKFTVVGDALVMPGAFSATRVPFNQIARVEKSTYRIRKHLLFGLGIGFGVGAAVGAAFCDSSCSESVLPLAFIGGGIGVGVGAAVGAAMNRRNGSRDVLYDVNRQPTTIAIAPIISRTHKGVNFTITWR